VRTRRRRTAARQCGVFAALLAAPAVFADTLVTFRMLDPDVALEMAQAALDSCRNKSFQVTVAVVDRMGVPQVVLRDRFAGAHTPESATRKAATAVSFRADTLTLADNTTSDSAHSGARFIDGILMLGGGVPVTAAGSVVAGIGVAGAPSSSDDHACAQAGIAAVTARLELAE
jgi:uncharacterized protein GlcG (DUF336 family)